MWLHGPLVHQNHKMLSDAWKLTKDIRSMNFDNYVETEIVNRYQMHGDEPKDISNMNFENYVKNKQLLMNFSRD